MKWYSSLQHRPHSLLLYELMCWCWSDLPNHRPSFTIILNILKSDMFIHLLASFSVLKEDEEVTTSCIRLMRTRRSSGSVSLSHSTMMDQSLASLGIMSLVYGKPSSGGYAGGGEYATQVWYGTQFGKYGVIQFQNNGIIHEVCTYYNMHAYMLCFCTSKCTLET